MDAKFGMVGENVHSVIFTSDTKPSTTQSRFAHATAFAAEVSTHCFFSFLFWYFREAPIFLYFGVISSISKVLVCFSFSLIFRVFSIFSKPLKNNVSDSICFNFTTKLFREILIMTEMHDSIKQVSTLCVDVSAPLFGSCVSPRRKTAPAHLDSKCTVP